MYLFLKQRGDIPEPPGPEGNSRDQRVSSHSVRSTLLLGLTVEDADTGAVYGSLSDVTGTAGANDVYHITFPDGRVQLIPAIPQVVIQIDIDAGRMRIRPLEGLFE